MPDPRELPIRAAFPCRYCGRPALLDYQASGALSPRWSVFDCPHCEKPNVARLPGNIVSVAKIEAPPS